MPRGATKWYYNKRSVNVAFDKNGHVDDLEAFSHRDRTNKGIGPGSTYAQFKKAYPKAKCTSDATGHMCDVRSTFHGRKVDTAFPFFVGDAGMREVAMGFVPAV